MKVEIQFFTTEPFNPRPLKLEEVWKDTNIVPRVGEIVTIQNKAYRVIEVGHRVFKDEAHVVVIHCKLECSL